MVLQPVEHDLQRIRSFLHRHRRRHVFRMLLRRQLFAVGLFLFALAALQAIFTLFPWTMLPVVGGLLIAGWALWAVVLVVHSVFRGPDHLTMARLVEAATGSGHHYLSLAVELTHAPPPGGSEQLCQNVVKRAAQSISELPHRLPAKSLRPSLFVLVLGGVLALVATIPQPRLGEYWYLALPSRREHSYRIEPGTVRLPLNSSINLRMNMGQAKIPSSVIAIRTAKGTRTALLRPTSENSFEWTIDSLRETLVYSFGSGSRVFNYDTIHVVRPPVLRDLHLTVLPPAYTGLPVLSLPPGQGSFSAYPGTTVRLRVGTGSRLSRASLISTIRDSVHLLTDSIEAVGEMVVSGNEEYSFSFVDPFGQVNDSLPTFRIESISDHPPFARIVKPAANKALTTEQVETLWVSGADDLGLRSLVLSYRTTSALPISESRSLPVPATSTSVTQEIVWDMKELSLYPGDTVFYWAIATDNCAFPHTQRSVSDTFYFRIPSIAEIVTQVHRDQQSVQEGLSWVRKSQDEVRQSLEQIEERSHQTRAPSWEDRRSVESIAQRMAAQSDSLERALENLQKSVDQMRKEELAQSSVLDKMEQVRKALEELRKAYGDSLLIGPRDPREQLSWQDLTRELEKLKEQLPDLERQLDHALSFLENIRQDRQLAALAYKAQRFAQEQRELASGALSRERQSSQQKDLVNRIGEMLDEIDGFSPEQSAPPAAQSTRTLQQQFQKQLAQGNLPRAEHQRSLSGSLLSLSEELREMMSGSMAARAQQDRQALLALSQEMLELSHWKEEILAGPAAGFVEPSKAAREQALRDAYSKSVRRIDDLRVVPPQELRSLSKRAQEAGSALQKRLDDAQKGNPGDSEYGVLALRQLSAQALHTARQMAGDAQGQAQGGAQGVMGGLRRLSGKQAAINAMTGQILREMMQGEGMNGRGSSAASTLKEEARRAQEEIARKLQELAQQGSGDARLSRQIEELGQEARRLSSLYENPGQQIQERQERLLSRMLEAALSIHKQREGNEERKAVSAKTIFSDTRRGHLKIENAADAYFLIRNRVVNGNYPEEYRGAVQTYADSLGSLFLR